MADKLLSKFLRNSASEANAIGNYSAAPEIFYGRPPPDMEFSLHRLLVTIEDAPGMDADEYGKLGGPLPNGIVLRYANDEGEVDDFTDGEPVLTNAGWTTFAHEVDLKTWGQGNETITVRWVLFEGNPLILHGPAGARLEVVLNDDFTGLVKHLFCAQGTRRRVARPS